MNTINSFSLIKSVLCKSIVLALVLLSFQISALSKYNRDLYYAIQSGDQYKVKEVIENGADVNEAFKDGQTPILFASSRFSKEVIQILIDKGADVNSKDENGYTPLLKTIRSESIENFKLLIENGADINQLKEGYNTPLMFVIDKDLKDLLPTVLNKTLDINAKGYNNKTALMCAAEKGNYDLALYLLNKGADVNAVDKYGWTHLLYSTKSLIKYSSNGEGILDLNLFKLLVNKGADVNAKEKGEGEGEEYSNNINGGCVLTQVISESEAVKLLLNKNVNVNASDNNGKTALMYALANEDQDIPQEMIEKGADIRAIDKEGKTVLMYAISGKVIGIEQKLIDKGVDINAKDNNGKTALMYAVDNEELEVVKKLIDYGADINAKDNEGRTALMHISSEEFDLENLEYYDYENVDSVNIYKENLIKNQVENILYLLYYKADINSKDNSGKTALMYASKIGNTKVLQTLIDNKADINAKDNKGNSAYFYSLSNKKNDCINLLITQKAKFANINEELMCFIQLNDLQKAQELISKGANVNTKDIKGLTPIMNALSNGYDDIFQLLVNNKADVNAKNSNGNSALMLVLDEGINGINNPVKYGDTVNIDSVMKIIRHVCTRTKKNIKTLINNKAEVNAINNEGETALIKIIGSIGNESMPDIFINDNQQIGDIQLLDEIYSAKKEIIELLLLYKANINLLDTVGYPKNIPTLLVVMDKYRNIERDLSYSQSNKEYLTKESNYLTKFIKFLTLNKANLNSEDEYGWTPLIKAINMGNKDLVGIFIKAGANVNYLTNVNYNSNTTPLITAIGSYNENGFKDIVKLLINHKANPDLTCEDCASPLMKAVGQGKKEIVQMLIKAGANVNYKTSYGSTALKSTDFEKNKDIAQMLIKAGANRADAVKWTYYNYWYCGNNTSCIEKMKFLFENYSFSHISSITFQLKILDKNNVTLYKQQHTVNVDLDHEEKANCNEFYLGKQVVLTDGDFEDQDNYNIEVDILSVR